MYSRERYTSRIWERNELANKIDIDGLFLAIGTTHNAYTHNNRIIRSENNGNDTLRCQQGQYISKFFFSSKPFDITRTH